MVANVVLYEGVLVRRVCTWRTQGKFLGYFCFLPLFLGWILPLGWVGGWVEWGREWWGVEHWGQGVLHQVSLASGTREGGWPFA